MKITRSELRRMIKEEFSRSVPDYAIRQISEECADSVKKLIINHVNTKAKSAQEKQMMLGQAATVIDELEDDIKQLVDNTLAKFFNKTSY